MTIHIDPRADQLTKLCKLLGMLGSTHAGERAAAGLKAHELIKAMGLTWPDVIGGKASAKAKWRDTINGKISEALQCPQILNEWELGFCKSLLGRTKLTARQQICLDKISVKVTAFQAARKRAA
jgi:hypothetical protein